MFDGVDCGLDGIGEVFWLEVAQNGAFEPAPNALDGVELRAGSWQPAELYPQAGGQLATCLGGVGAAPIEKQHHVPATPRIADAPQMVTPREAVPASGSFDATMPRANVDGAKQRTLTTVAADRNLGWIADERPACTQRRCLGKNGRVAEEDDGPYAILQAALEPPFDCRHVSPRRRRTKRGRFQR